MAHSTLRNTFFSRHIGPDSQDTSTMLELLKSSSLSELINSTAPDEILNCSSLDLHQGLSEADFLSKAKQVAKKNKVYKSYIEMRYYG